MGLKGREGWIKMGEFLGYPKCCSEWSHDQDTRIKPIWEYMDEIQTKVDEEEGFIPCPSCAKNVLDNKETLSSLIKNRHCSTPYPVFEVNQIHEFDEWELQDEINTIKESINKIILELECKNDNNEHRYLIEQLKSLVNRGDM